MVWFFDGRAGNDNPGKDFFTDYRLLSEGELDRLTFEPDRKMALRAFTGIKNGRRKEIE